MEQKSKKHSIEIGHVEGYADLSEEKKEEGDITTSNIVQKLSKENIDVFTSQLGAEMNNIRYDLIASNEFCQIGIGMGLVKGEDTEKNNKCSDDLIPNVTHDGSIGKPVAFLPQDRDFTIVFEIKCDNVNAGNTLFSNGKFEYIAPRARSKRIAVRLIQKDKKKKENTELQNIGETELSQNIWYHIVIVCYRANDQDKRPQTDFKVFLNGISDGEISIKKESEGGGILSSIGGLFGKKKKKRVEYTPTIGMSPINDQRFSGIIQNVKIFYKALERQDVKQLAYRKENNAYIQPSIISYNKHSLKVAVPKCDMRYRGPNMVRLPEGFQAFKPDKKQSFTITAWIYCRRIATNGSVILTNINESKYDNTGFEFICPTNKSNVIGLRCSNSSDIIPIGTTKIKINKFYHIAITIEHVITQSDEPDQTDIVAYINDKIDGTYNFKKCKDYFNEKGSLWSVGHNVQNEQGTRFDGSIFDIRIFFKALTECEISCVYASSLKERQFKTGHIVYYLFKNKITCQKCNTSCDDWGAIFCGQCGTEMRRHAKDSNHSIDITSRQTFIPNSSWRKAEFKSIDLNNCSVIVQDMNNSLRKVVKINEIIPADKQLLQFQDFIPGTESQNISNLGGLIHGLDFDGNEFKINSMDPSFFQYICRPSSLFEQQQYTTTQTPVANQSNEQQLEKAQPGEINPNPLRKCSLEELSKDNINSFKTKISVLEFVIGDHSSACNYDLIASNQFCQIAIGNKLFEEKDEYFDHDEKEDDEYKVYRRPRDDSIDMDVGEAQADLIHAGVVHLINDQGLLDISGDASCPPIGFKPGTRNFTICCDVWCSFPATPNALCANGLIDFFIYQSKVAVRTSIHPDLTNISNVKLVPQFWYHIGIVCQRKQIIIDDGKDKGTTIDVTEFKIYMDGVEAGIISLNGICNLDGDALIGRTYNEQAPNHFEGAIENFKLFYRDLSDDEIFTIASNENNKSYKATKLITYKPSSLKIAVPQHIVKYNGAIPGILPKHLSFTCYEEEEMSITAYIMLIRANSKHGSVILTNRSMFTGFELICPLPKTNVIGMKCIGSRDYDLIPLGKTKFKLNKFYHISVTISREDNDTHFIAYVNGKKDGSYNLNGMPNLLSGAEWNIGHRESKPIKTRFDGSIQNLKIFGYALCEAEVASLYASDLRQCNFMKNKPILYLSPNINCANHCPKCNQRCDFASKFCNKCRAPLKEKSMLQFENEETDKKHQNPNTEQKQTQHETEFNFLHWEKGIFINKNINKGTVTIFDKDNKQKILMLNEIIKPEKEISATIPATDALKIDHENIGGWIMGVDFDDNEWSLFTTQCGLVKYLVTSSCFSQLINLQRFPKHIFENIINNTQIRNCYVLNRLLYVSHEILKIQSYSHSEEINKKWWKYFNEYILPWAQIWLDKSNGECLCGAIMEKKLASKCYDPYYGIACDQCRKSVDSNTLVFHCNKQQTLQHEGGYDCCIECAYETNFDKLKRATKTLQKKYAQLQSKLIVTHWIRNNYNEYTKVSKGIVMIVAIYCDIAFADAFENKKL